MHTTPRLSIVVPVGSSIEAFEATLLSVLENRPDGCEILVCHDGSYDDPFALGDEVRFVTSDSRGLIDSIAAGCDAAWGRYVHVIANGVQATAGWSDAAMNEFADFSIGAVAPVANQGDRTTGGWIDRASARMSDAEGTEMNRPSTPGRACGSHLHMSFWRRELLRSLTRSCVSDDVTIAQYAFAVMARQNGWRCKVADKSRVHVETIRLAESPRQRAAKLEGVARALRGTTAMQMLVRSAKNLIGGGGIAASIGMVTEAVKPSVDRRWFESANVQTLETYQEVRRAA